MGGEWCGRRRGLYMFLTESVNVAQVDILHNVLCMDERMGGCKDNG